VHSCVDHVAEGPNGSLHVKRGDVAPDGIRVVEAGGLRPTLDIIAGHHDRVRAELTAARADLNAASLRRLLTSSSANSTFATMMSIAEALGLRIEIRKETSVERMFTAS